MKEKKFYGNTMCQEDGVCFRFCDRLYAVDACGDLFSASIEDLTSVENFSEYCQLPYDGYNFFQLCRIKYCSSDFKTVIRLGLTQCYDVAKGYYDDYVKMAESADEEDEWLTDRVKSAKKHLDNLSKLIAKC